jgi:hypothetical protein
MNMHGLNNEGKMKMYYGAKVIKKFIDQFKEKHTRMKKKISIQSTIKTKLS